MNIFLEILRIFFILAMFFFIIRGLKNITVTKPGFDDKFYEHFFAHFIRFVQNADDSQELYLQAFRVIIDQNYFPLKANFAFKKAVRFLKKKANFESTVRRTYKLNHIARVRIIDLLFKIAASDRRISIKELAYIESVYKILRVTPETFYKIKSFYIAEEEKRFENQSKTQYSQQSSNSLIHDACSILNVNINDDFDIIKKAYRNLVKQNHPDIFATMSNEVQEIAEAKFRVINEAYNYIKEYKNVS